ncbi:squalene/phytoene synthase family protein [Sphingorhabdus sp. SMR4y]|uniref:squalene/phytoene synthase family protein n=1 Tax=Sphingorhabdus sp. SMR4y TaxID=2584094 RepID=UPI0016413F09|nr:squalene/phytoene synthase family protein [Sphingorhabdus sp. SMR4y]
MSDTVLQLEPIHRLIHAYAKQQHRSRYALLFALDARLADIIRSTSEILIGQMRLTWWRDVLTKPAAERPAGEPLVEQINHLEEKGANLAPLLTLLDGWEAMLEDFPWGDREFDNYAVARGRGFFAFGLSDETALSDRQADLGQAWALWDFARHCSDAAMRQSAFDRCSAIVKSRGAPDFDRSGRPLSILCKLMIHDVRKGQLAADLYSPASAVRIIWHGIAGR